MAIIQESLIFGFFLVSAKVEIKLFAPSYNNGRPQILANIFMSGYKLFVNSDAVKSLDATGGEGNLRRLSQISDEEPGAFTFSLRNCLICSRFQLSILFSRMSHVKRIGITYNCLRFRKEQIRNVSL